MIKFIRVTQKPTVNLLYKACCSRKKAHSQRYEPKTALTPKMSQAVQVENPLPAGNKSESIYGTITCFFIYVWRFRDNLHVNQNIVWQSSKANQGQCNVRWRSKYKIPRRITDQSSYSRHLRCFLPRVSTALNFLVEKKQYAVPKMSSKHRKNTSVSLSMSNLLEEPLQFAAVLIMTTLFIFAHTLGILFSIYVLLTPLYGFMVIYLLWTYCFDMKTPSKGGRRYEAFRRLKTWDYFRDYFPVRLIRTKRLDPKKNYILGYHPHGIMCAGAWANFATEATGFSDLFPGIKSHLLTLKCKSHVYLF